MKKTTWNIRRLVDDSFVPSARRTSVLYCRLTDFMQESRTENLLGPDNNIEFSKHFMNVLGQQLCTGL